MKSRELSFYIVDVFAETKYSGNQLAVFTDAQNISSSEMADIARETNFSETTFITGYNTEQQIVDTRIFTPGGEVPFAGHPTLGTAYIANKVLFNGKAETITLNVMAGKIPVNREGEILWMSQIQPQFGQIFDPDLMADLLGLDIEDFDLRYPIEYVSTGLPFFMVPVKKLDSIRKINLNTSKAIDCMKDMDTQQMLVFAPESYSPEDKIACRVFVPALGIFEDPATGSANGCLSAYLLKHNYFGTSEIDFSVAQGYEIKRPSRLHLKASLQKETYSIKVGGKVVEVAEGKWS